MLTDLHKNHNLQLFLGLLSGIIFGFLLQKGGATRFDIIISQLLLRDWRIMKLLFSAIITGSIGIHILVSLNLARLHPKPGSIGMNIIGGIIFGIGFAILGYCPGIVAGAAGQGSLDALVSGFTGILIGSGLFINLYPFLESRVLKWGAWKKPTIFEMLKINRWIVVSVVVLIMGFCLWILETNGL